MRWITLIYVCLAAGCNQQIVSPAASSTSDSQSTVPANASATDPVSGAPGVNEIEILAEGVAALEFETGMDIARDHALDDALRKAIEQGVGTYIDSETRVNNFQLISDEIYSKAHGYVSSYRVIHEENDGDLYRVVIRAVVNTTGIENDLVAIGILMREQGRPRVMVIVKELDSITDLSDENTLMSSIMFETMLLDNFRQQGFPVVDASTVADILERDQLKLILEGDDHTAALIGLSVGAEIVIAGTAMYTVNSRMIAGSHRDIHEFQVSSRAINTRTGIVLGGSAITAALPFSESQARTQAADSTSSQLISAILSGWVDGENVTVIVVTNADFDRIQALRSELRLKIRGVLDVIIRDLTGSRATLEVTSETGTIEVVDDLVSSEIDVSFEVTGISGNRVEIRFTD